MPYQAFFDQTRNFGIEIECYTEDVKSVVDLYDLISGDVEKEVIVGDIYDKNRDLWTIGRDNTIEGPNPTEIITPKLHGIIDLYLLKYVVEHLPDFGFKVNESCGLHIHWDARDFTGFQLMNLLKLYAKYEPVIDLFFPAHRRKNNNPECRSLIKDGGSSWIDDLANGCYPKAYEVADAFEKKKKVPNSRSFPSARHHKVNIASINKYGTVEFRQHHGTLEWREIYSWIMFTQQLMNKAKAGVTVTDTEPTLGSLVRLLAMSQAQLAWYTHGENAKKLAVVREFYKEIYRRNSNENQI